MIVVFLPFSEYIAAEENLAVNELSLNLSKNALIAPAEGNVRSYFGPRIVLQQEQKHLGVDISSAENDGVYVVADGYVAELFTECTAIGHVGSVCGNGYGNYIQIQHEIDGQKFETLYAHLGETLVQKGEFVNINDQIVTIGSSGNTAGKSTPFRISYTQKE